MDKEIKKKILPEGREKLITNQEESMVTNNSTDKSEVFIGQEQLLKKINILVDKARSTNKPLPHMLFVGEDGMGKETLAKIIAKQLNRKVTNTSGSAIIRVGDLVGVVTSLEEGDILLINDIETLNREMREYLIPSIRDYEVDVVMDKGAYARTYKFKLKHFTFIGTTSRPERVDKSLMKLFYSVYTFVPHGKEDILKVFEKKAKAEDIKLDDEAIKYIVEIIDSKKIQIAGLSDKIIKFSKLADIKLITKDVVNDCLQTIEESENYKIDVDRTIPEEVRLKVWRRDNGKCVKCGSQERLEFDHMIPVSKGGSNTARNIQILCEKCNREKSDDIS